MHFNFLLYRDWDLGIQVLWYLQWLIPYSIIHLRQTRINLTQPDASATSPPSQMQINDNSSGSMVAEIHLAPRHVPRVAKVHVQGLRPSLDPTEYKARCQLRSKTCCSSNVMNFEEMLVDSWWNGFFFFFFFFSDVFTCCSSRLSRCDTSCWWFRQVPVVTGPLFSCDDNAHSCEDHWRRFHPNGGLVSPTGRNH